MNFDGVILVDKPEGWTSFKTDGAVKSICVSAKATIKNTNAVLSSAPPPIRETVQVM